MLMDKAYDTFSPRFWPTHHVITKNAVARTRLKRSGFCSRVNKARRRRIATTMAFQRTGAAINAFATESMVDVMNVGSEKEEW